MSRKKELNNIEVEEVVESVEEPVEVIEINTEEEVKVEQPIIPVIKHVKNVQLRVRKFPVVGDNIIRVLDPNSEVYVYEEIDGWARISEEQSEYVMADFLE